MEKDFKRSERQQLDQNPKIKDIEQRLEKEELTQDIDESQLYQEIHTQSKQQGLLGRGLVQLDAFIKTISPNGLLTIKFNKPIIKPNIRIQNKIDGLEHNEQNTMRDKQMQDMDVDNNQLEIDEVFDIQVESDFYESESDYISILSYEIVRLTESIMEIQVYFKMP